jgi:hypothetical protein
VEELEDAACLYSCNRSRDRSREDAGDGNRPPPASTQPMRRYWGDSDGSDDEFPHMSRTKKCTSNRAETPRSAGLGEPRQQRATGAQVVGLLAHVLNDDIAGDIGKTVSTYNEAQEAHEAAEEALAEAVRKRLAQKPTAYDLRDVTHEKPCLILAKETGDRRGRLNKVYFDKELNCLQQLGSPKKNAEAWLLKKAEELKAQLGDAFDWLR